MRLLIILSALLLSGCATARVSKIRGPNGTDGLSIRCGNNIDDCYNKAAELCPKGYSNLNTPSSQSGFVASGNMLIPVSRNNMFIECK
jgi:hypothetical protein